MFISRTVLGGNMYRSIPNQFRSLEVECFELVTDLATYRFIVVYRPPDFNALGREYMSCLYDFMQYLCDNT